MSVRVTQLWFGINAVMISIGSEYLDNEKTDVLRFPALLHIMNKRDCLQIQTCSYSSREHYLEFCIETLQGRFLV